MSEGRDLLMDVTPHVPCIGYKLFKSRLVSLGPLSLELGLPQYLAGHCLRLLVDCCQMLAR